MKLWLAKNSEVPIRKQLVAQVTVGIACGDLRIGEKLPSTRELARRFGIHQNTVSSAYRELDSQGLVEFKRGSGVYVRETKPLKAKSVLDTLITKFFTDAESLGFSRADVIKQISESLNGKPNAGFVVAESNTALREIVVEEISAATGTHVRGIAQEEIGDFELDGFHLTAMFDEADRLDRLLPDGMKCIYLKANSVAGTLAGQQRPALTELIGVVSAWDDFLTFAKLYLLAARVDSETIITCRRGERGWQRALKNASTIICDSVTAKKLASDERVKVFPIIAENSLDELRSAAQGTILSSARP